MKQTNFNNTLQAVITELNNLLLTAEIATNTKHLTKINAFKVYLLRSFADAAGAADDANSEAKQANN